MTNPTTDEMCRIVYEAFFKHRSSHKDGRLYYDVLALAHSLDDWPPIWEAMSQTQKSTHHLRLKQVMYDSGVRGKFRWEATAMHHLEAAYNVVKGGK